MTAAMLWAALLSGSLLGRPGPARGEIVERIVAVVGRRIVLLSELEARFRELLPQLQRIRDPAQRARQAARLRRVTLDRLINDILVEEAGRKRKLRVTEAEVERAIQTVLKQSKLTRAELIATLAQEGYSFSAYRQDLRRQILRLKTINLAVRSRIQVSWDEVRAAYQKSVARMGVGRKVRVRQIVLRVREGDKRHLSEQLARARKLLRLLHSGQVSFADLARKVSNDPASRARGGDLGFVGRGTLPPPVETVVFAAKGTGVLLGPVVAEGGVYLLRIEEEKASMALPFDQVRHRLRRQIYNARAARRTAAWIRSLRQRALVDIRL